MCLQPAALHALAANHGMRALAIAVRGFAYASWLLACTIDSCDRTAAQQCTNSNGLPGMAVACCDSIAGQIGALCGAVLSGSHLGPGTKRSIHLYCGIWYVVLDFWVHKAQFELPC